MDQIEDCDDVDLFIKKGEKTKKKKKLPSWLDRVYHVWRSNFQEDRCCNKKEVRKEFLTASVPIIVLNVVLVIYIVFGSEVFKQLEMNVHEKSSNKLMLFCFTTIATIGYGDIYPISFNGKIVCMLYCVIGIPLLLTTISTNSLVFVDIYNIIHKSFNPKANHVKALPWFISLFLLICHCIIGGIIFSCWIDDMSFISALYFSFISISTIGFGDFLPTPEDWFQHIVIITFLSTGIGILTTFFGALQDTVMWIHNIGRKLTNTGDAEIWFDGNMMTIRELVVIVSERFKCTPEKLRDVLHDLDEIMEVVCSQSEDKPEEEKIRLLESGHSVETTPKRKKTVILNRPSVEDDNQATIHSFTGSNQRTLPRETELAIQALGAIQHHLRKPSTRAKPGQSRTQPVVQKTMTKTSSDAMIRNKTSPINLDKKFLRVTSDGKFATNFSHSLD